MSGVIHYKPDTPRTRECAIRRKRRGSQYLYHVTESRNNTPITETEMFIWRRNNKGIRARIEHSYPNRQQRRAS